MTHFSSYSDDTLVELAQLGEEAAYEELVRRYENSVIGTAWKITENRFSAQDASQDAFVSAWIHLDRLQNRQKFGPWVCSIAKNKARTLIIHYRNTIPDISLEVLAEIPDEETDMLGLTRDDTAQELHAAVEALSEKIREVVKLHYFEGLSVAEIANALSLPAGTVKWRLSEGRKQLRKEYGLMEENYDENEQVLSRVMRQVEQLKLWRLKEDKTGLETEYRQVLKNVEALPESKEQQHALADTLVMGYWWLPGEQNNAVLARMKEAAIKGHNEDVMEAVMDEEFRSEKLSDAQRLDLMKNTQIPFLEEQKFVKALAYVWFWYGHYSAWEGHHDDCIQAYQKVLEILKPEDVYYANALAALEMEEKCHRLGLEESRYSFAALGEVYKYIDGKLYFWEQPGYSRGSLAPESHYALMWNCSRVDKMIYDPGMKPGDIVTAKDGKLTCTADGVTVHTPAGTFQNCTAFVYEGTLSGITHCETVFCPNVGIVQQNITRHEKAVTWQLQSYTVKGGNGLLPFATGNKWSYTVNSPEGMVCATENTLEVTAADKNSVTVKAYSFTQLLEYDESWYGYMLQFRNRYYGCKDDELADVGDTLVNAARLAETKRQKRHTAIATNVLERIYATDPKFSPDYTEKGFWNFFSRIGVISQNGRVTLLEDWDNHFEWKDSIRTDAGYKVLYNFLYDILWDAAGCVWDDRWQPGYHTEQDRHLHRDLCHLVLDVLPEETVSTPAGTFTGCRHITFTFTGRKGGHGYRGGTMDYWFAPQVGIVKFSRPYGKNKSLDCIWELTEYIGTGDGFFPTDDGLFRRYEPKDMAEGWHGAVEYTFDVGETGTVLFHNALGTQDRENYEKDLAEKEKAK